MNNIVAGTRKNALVVEKRNQKMIRNVSRGNVENSSVSNTFVYLGTRSIFFTMSSPRNELFRSEDCTHKFIHQIDDVVREGMAHDESARKELQRVFSRG